MRKGLFIFGIAFLQFLSFCSASILDVIKDGAVDRYRSLSSNESAVVYALIFGMIFVLVFEALRFIPAFKENKPTSLIISIIVSILSIYWMSEVQIAVFFLSNTSILGFLMITLLPFVIFFLFLHSSNLPLIMRKIGWIFFAFVFGYLFYSRYSVINDFQKYFFIAISVLIVLFYIFDSQIHKFFLWRKMKQENKAVSG